MCWALNIDLENQEANPCHPGVYILVGDTSNKKCIYKTKRGSIKYYKKNKVG